jgi:hypothetical protein
MLLGAMTKGLSPPVLSRLLAQADRWLQSRFDARLRTERPHPGAPRIRAVAAIARHLAQPNTAVLITVDGAPRYAHWTVVKKVAEVSLILFDSDGLSRLSLDHTTRATIRLRPRDVYLLRCEP